MLPSCIPLNTLVHEPQCSHLVSQALHRLRLSLNTGTVLGCNGKHSLEGKTVMERYLSENLHHWVVRDRVGKLVHHGWIGHNDLVKLAPVRHLSAFISGEDQALHRGFKATCERVLPLTVLNQFMIRLANSNWIAAEGVSNGPFPWAYQRIG